MPSSVQERFSGKSIKQLVNVITTVERVCLVLCKLTNLEAEHREGSSNGRFALELDLRRRLVPLSLRTGFD